MAHNISVEAEKILDQTFPILNAGFVRLIDYLGTDRRIVQAARVSFGTGEKSPEEDRKLIHYLMKNLHTSPFEQVIMTFHIKMPIFVMRQHVHHRTARLNEISGRYSILKDEFFIPDMGDIRPQSKTNKQGRDEQAEIYDEVKIAFAAFAAKLKSDQALVYKHYEEAVNMSIAKEIARINLPLSTYMEIYWQIDAHNLMHFLKLRLHQHAQKEIRVYAEKIFEIFKLICPVTCEAFIEYVLEAKTFSKSELEEMGLK
jgi:thymidylate synthase (FAD)